MKKIIGLLIMGCLLMPLGACEREEGPAEELGESIDETREDVQDAVDEAGDELN